MRGPLHGTSLSGVAPVCSRILRLATSGDLRDELTVRATDPDSILSTTRKTDPEQRNFAMNRLHTLAVCAASIAALTGVTACSSSSHGTPARSFPPATSTPPGAAAATGTDAAGTTPSATAAAGGAATTTPGSASNGGASGPTRCAESQLRASVVAANIPSLNRHVDKLTFTNTSGTTCILSGYPGAAVVDSSGKQVQQAERVVGGPVGGTIEKSAGPVTLRAGTTAYAWLEGSSTREQGAAQAGCDGPRYPRILVTPPNTETAVPFTIGWPVCYSFDVHPVRQD